MKMSFKKHLKKISAVICAVAICMGFTACGIRGAVTRFIK